MPRETPKDLRDFVIAVNREVARTVNKVLDESPEIIEMLRNYMSQGVVVFVTAEVGTQVLVTEDFKLRRDLSELPESEIDNLFSPSDKNFLRGLI